MVCIVVQPNSTHLHVKMFKLLFSLQTFYLKAMATGLNIIFNIAQPADSFRIIVGKEAAATGIHGGDLRHLLIGEGEIKNIDIGLDAFLMYGFRNADNAALHQPAQSDLGG